MSKGLSENDIGPAPVADSPANSAHGTLHVFCPHCLRPTDRLKAYQIGRVVYLVVEVVCTYETVIACPSCMRKAIASRLLMAVITANLVFPIVACFYLWQFGATFFAGHSDLAIAAENRRTLEDRLRGAEPDVKLSALPGRKAILRYLWLLGVAILLLPVVLAFMGMCMYLAANNW